MAVGEHESLRLLTPAEVAAALGESDAHRVTVGRVGRALPWRQPFSRRWQDGAVSEQLDLALCLTAHPPTAVPAGWAVLTPKGETVAVQRAA